MSQSSKSARNVIIVAVFLLVLIVLFANIKKNSPIKEAQPGPDIASASYEILDREVYDAPIKTQVVLHALVSGTITESSLKQLLQAVYDEAEATRGFKYHGGTPSHVAVYLYTSRDHWKSGWGQWIAMETRFGDGASTNTQIRAELIAQHDRPPEEKFGLSEETRKEIFEAIVQAEDKAIAEAEQRYPLEPTLFLSVGDTFTLTQQTTLMPESEPSKPLAGFGPAKLLPARTKITVDAVNEEDIYPIYHVSASSGDSGWIHSVALTGQSSVDKKDQMAKQYELQEELTEKYRADVAERYHVTEDQLRAISREALEENWPFPSVE